MPSQRDIIELSKITPQQTGVPADHFDPNHPYFPHDSEARLPPRYFVKARTCLNKKRFFIISSLILVLSRIIASLVVGIKIGLPKCSHDQVTVCETSIVTPTSTGGTIEIIPEPTYTTMTMHTTTGGLKPTATVSFIKAPPGLTSVISPQETCTRKGSWQTIEGYKGNCYVPGIGRYVELGLGDILVSSDRLQMPRHFSHFDDEGDGS